MRALFFDGAAAQRPGAAEIERLRRDPEGEGVPFGLQVADVNRLAHLRGMRDATDRLRRALEAELSGRGRAARGPDRPR